MYEDRIRRVLLGFKMISEGTTSASPDSDVGHGKRHSDGSPPPRCAADYDHWREVFATADTERKLYWRLLCAEQALDRAHKAPRHLGDDGLAELPEHRTMRILNARGAPMEVAAKFHCTASHVWILRWRDKRDPETGVPWPEDRGDRQKAARSLKADGYTVRQIADRIGVPKSTVGDYLAA